MLNCISWQEQHRKHPKNDCLHDGGVWLTMDTQGAMTLTAINSRLPNLTAGNESSIKQTKTQRTFLRYCFLELKETL
jgi:hypothetical protein